MRDKHHYNSVTTIAGAWAASKTLAAALWAKTLKVRNRPLASVPDDVGWAEPDFTPNPMVCKDMMVPRAFVWDAHYIHLM